MKKFLRAVLILTILLGLHALALSVAAAGGVVRFTDPALETMVREQMDIPEGDITTEQAEQVEDLDLHQENSAELPDDQLIHDISSLQYFPNLFKLSLYDNRVTDISVLAGMEGLKYLDLGNNQISDISPLKNLPLVELCLGFNQITDFSPLAGMTTLEYLWVSGNATRDYAPLSGIIGNLTDRDFEIYDTPFGRSEVIEFNDPALEQKVRQALNLPEGDVTAGDAATLDYLDCDMPQGVSDGERIRDVSALRFFVNLTCLKLDNNLIEDIRALEGLTNLQELYLLDNPTGDLPQLSGMTQMIRLGIVAGTEDFSFLNNMPELEELRIDGLDTLPAELLNLPHLTIFCSLNGGLTDISLLARIPALTAIDLSWNFITDLTPLSGLPLTELYLQGNPIEDYSPIADIYPNLAGRNFEYIETFEPDDPDAVIAFPDPVLEQKIRAAIGKPEGELTAGDAAQVTGLSIANDWQAQIPREIKVTDLTGLEYFINLRELDAGFNDITDLSPLAGLTQLRKLNLGGNTIIDLSPLAGLTKLEELTLYGNGIRDIGPLAGLQSLHSLHLGNDPVGDLSPLAGLANLDCLYLGGCGITDIGALAGLTNLYSLELSDNSITDLTALSGMQNLRNLKLAGNPVADYAPIEAIYPQLEEKDFEYGQAFDAELPRQAENSDAKVAVGDDALEAILREVTGVYDRSLTQNDLSGIGKLVIEDNSMWQNVGDLSALQYCVNLEGLVIEGSQVSDLSPLGKLTKIRGIKISNSQISDLTPLEGLQTLTYLELQGNQITDISVLRSLGNLERVDLSVNQIADFSPLYGLQNLTALQIKYNATEDVSGLRDIAGRLEEKDFDPAQPLEISQMGGDAGNNGRQEEEEQEEAVVVTFPDPVMERRVRDAIGKPEGEITTWDTYAVDSLFLNNEWQESYDEGSQITDITGIEYFVNLRRLDISWNLIADIQPLAGMQLEYLRMYGNQVGDISALAGMSTLYNLNIGGNLITDISALATLVNLGELNLADNPIEDYTPVKAIYPQLQSKDFTLE